ncbi:MAG: hypothetical protein LBQ61_10155, partial [Spirochaetales bacterium]|nr:hypothetical protein [Spirochaetales bacterium]
MASQDQLTNADDEGLDDLAPTPEEAELEQYGVWVKVGPEDIQDSSFDDAKDFQLEDLELPESEVQEDNLLTDEEENLLGNLENNESLNGDDDFSLDFPENTGDTEEGEFNEGEAPEGDDFSFEEEVNSRDLDFPDSPGEEDLFGGEPEIREIDLDAEEGFSGDDGILPTAKDGLSDLEESDLIQSDFGETLQELDRSESENAGPPKTGRGRDLDALEKDLMETDQEISRAAAQDSKDTASILLKIEQELLAIRSELSSLKQELTHMKTEAPEVVKEKVSETGFFDEDDDETIALTGDELDNILNTADFTEASGEGGENPDLFLNNLTLEDLDLPQEDALADKVFQDSRDEIDLDIDLGLDLNPETDGSLSLDETSTEETPVEETPQEDAFAGKVFQDSPEE